MVESANGALHRLRELAQTIDRDFAAIRQRHDACMECRSGCSDCCRARLSVTHVEVELMRRGLERLPAKTRRELADQARDPQREMCPALDPEGRCTIYDSRPLICRSYGVPLRRRREVELVNPPTLEVCDKNFQDVSLRMLPEADVLDQTQIDRQVSEINEAYCATRGLAPGDRTPIAKVLIDHEPAEP